jgi:uncharacterized membrane protein YeaQ/YmgE (transglycosylase-associated protein family)
LFCEWDKNKPADRAVYCSKLTTCGEKEMVHDEETLSTLPDFFGGGPERASQRFWIQLFSLPHTKHQCCRTSKGISMLHLVWYILVGLIAGIIAKSIMHTHLTIFWTIVLGIIGSIIGGAVTHMFVPPRDQRFHPAGLIFSTLGAILVLFVCYKLKIRFPHV